LGLRKGKFRKRICQRHWEKNREKKDKNWRKEENKMKIWKNMKLSFRNEEKIKQKFKSNQFL
jgi:hypothetical protein